MTSPLTVAPDLDTAVEPWHGHFPGLGEIWVAVDGSTQVRPEVVDTDDPDSLAQRRQALTYGWAEPLSWHRRDFWMLQGVAASPDPRVGCVVLEASTSRGTRVLDRLAERGWHFLAERPTPVRIENDALVAHPRSAPFLQRNPKQADAHVRGDTDVIQVNRRRHRAPCVVRGVGVLVPEAVGVRSQKAVTGRDKLVMAATLRLGGVFASRDPSTGEASTEWLDSNARLARLPMTSVPVGQDPADSHEKEADLIEAWWSMVVDR